MTEELHNLVLMYQNFGCSDPLERAEAELRSRREERERQYQIFLRLSKTNPIAAENFINPIGDG